jgi:hypothetical protein
LEKQLFCISLFCGQGCANLQILINILGITVELHLALLIFSSHRLLIIHSPHRTLENPLNCQLSIRFLTFDCLTIIVIVLVFNWLCHGSQFGSNISLNIFVKVFFESVNYE